MRKEPWTSTTSELFTAEQVAGIEEHYGVTYVCETCIQRTEQKLWINWPVAIFYQSNRRKVPEGGSQWLGLFWRPDDLLDLDPDAPRHLAIVNAISATQTEIWGVTANNGQVIFSRYRTDYRVSDDGTIHIAGGRDYTHTDGGHVDGEQFPCMGRMVRMQIVRDKLVILRD